ncbi:MAG: Nif3-like dinuclear metal center hexameric protein [Bacteroidota bacterium]
MSINEVIQFLESIAPPVYQESYDNAGLIVGNRSTEITGVLCCLDSTEAVIEEAIQMNCKLVVAHHPIVFKGLKRFNGSNYVERTIIKAIKNDIAIYAIHTNLDNMLYQGVNTRIAETLGLENTRILAPKKNLKRVAAFGEEATISQLRSQLFDIGVGDVNGQSQVSYASLGVGTTAGKGAGRVKFEALFPVHLQGKVQRILHDFERQEALTYHLTTVENSNSQIGSGMIGQLPKAMKTKKFLAYLKERMRVSCIKHTAILKDNIQTIAFCGGAGGFLLRNAIGQKADVFITADYKYHEFFDADGRIMIADIGHYESEQFTINLLCEVLSQKFSNFAAHCTEVNTNPVSYYC